MNTMSHMLAILNYSGYAAYTKLAHGAKLSKQSMYKDSIFIKGTQVLAFHVIILEDYYL
ncbi:hypothetical protein ACA348_07685 [Orientia tsutsugamushi]|uniref:hypothetical protein n=1 Tax=Orientia tsutsugamushi TaxID=784 RepID=UPI0035292A38